MKISYFSFTVKLNEKNKVLLKTISFEGRVGNISKKGKGVLTRKRWRKHRGGGGGGVTLNKTMAKIIVTNFVAKKAESLVKLFWETSICFFIKTIQQQPVCSMLWQEQIIKNLFAVVPQAQKRTVFDCYEVL